MRAAAAADTELQSGKSRLTAAEQALEEVPTDAPVDAMLDFYNELSAAVRGRLSGADTLARVNDALRDIFQAFVLDPPPHPLGEGTFIVPILPPAGDTLDEVAEAAAHCADLARCVR